MAEYCTRCHKKKEAEHEALSSGCIYCGNRFFYIKDGSYNATKHWQEWMKEAVDEALIDGGIKAESYFNDIGTLIIEKERE
jgi:predicted  nucleic acid-binding Zn-ribbon protein